jgi:Flp pilus assembly protein TadG
MIARPALFRDRSASSAAEFALVLPVLLALIFLGIDGGRYLYGVNRIEKATQFGVRYAAVTDPVPGGLATASYVGTTVGSTTLGQGDTIPAAALGLIRCSNSSCTCVTTPCPALGTYNTAAFANIVARMKLVMPEIRAVQVTVEYRGSGVGFAGDPSGMQIAPLVTVKAAQVGWRSLTGFIAKKWTYPTIASSLTTEDSKGADSN